MSELSRQETEICEREGCQDGCYYVTHHRGLKTRQSPLAGVHRRRSGVDSFKGRGLGVQVTVGDGGTT